MRKVALFIVVAVLATTLSSDVQTMEVEESLPMEQLSVAEIAEGPGWEDSTTKTSLGSAEQWSPEDDDEDEEEPAILQPLPDASSPDDEDPAASSDDDESIPSPLNSVEGVQTAFHHANEGRGVLNTTEDVDCPTGECAGLHCGLRIALIHDRGPRMLNNFHNFRAIINFGCGFNRVRVR